MSKRIAIIGGGPIGIEAGVLMAQRGHDVTVYERGAPGAHVARWKHVNFFSPWSLNRSPWGAAILEEAGQTLADDEGFPTGAQYLQEYLRPLTEVGPLAGRVKTLTDVRAVTRRETWKGDYIGKPQRNNLPFILSVSGPDGDRWEEADVVIDASGVYANPNHIGPGGAPAIGESAASDYIERYIPDVLDRDRELYAGKRVLLLGDGHSATTTLRGLVALREEEPETETFWVVRNDAATGPYAELDDDPLPERLALSRFGNRAARGEVDGVTVLHAAPEAVEVHDGQLHVQFEPDTDPIVVDRVVSNVGYRPDTELTRELQVHHCWASEGPMKLAASLLAQSGNADCLTQEAAGVDTLRNPEPNFWVVGAKSYGRNSNFLLRVGFEQLEAIADALDE